MEVRSTSGKLLRRLNVPRPAWNQVLQVGSQPRARNSATARR